MHGKIWGTFGDEPATTANTVFWVKIPDLPVLPNSTRIAKLIRNNILRDEFGYTEADIKAFDKKYPTTFVIQSSEKSYHWATDQQFQRAKNGTDNLISIAIIKKALLTMESFREQRASFEVFKVGVFIPDAVLRQRIVGYLEAILTSWGQKRIDALGNLMVAIGSSSLKREIFQALRFLLNESGYKNNPFLLLAVAQAKLAPQFGANELDLAAIAKAVQATNDNLYVTD